LTTVRFSWWGSLLKKPAIALALASVVLLVGGARGQESLGGISGKVIETMNAGGYTYVHVDDGEKQIWAAAPGFTVSVGDEVVVPPGAPMVDHHSKTLDRTFELIYFVGGIETEGSGGEASKSPFVHSAGGPSAAARTLDLSDIARADRGKTVAEIFDEGAALAGQEVAVRGRVAKMVPRILGTNFVHLQDGTSSKDGRNDLTVTTKAEVEVGTLVLVRGVLIADKDFGHGYKYDLIIEDASVTEE
jgi:hypothetical protein